MALSRTGLIIVLLQLIHTILTQEMLTQEVESKPEIDKRVPQGFVGMRGKKYIEPTDMEPFYKRKPQFFVGVKGKKDDYNLPYLLEQYKRAPMGFVGMRGKKDLYSPDIYYPYDLLRKQGSLIGEIDYTADDIQAAQFPLLNELLNEYLQKMENPDKTNEIQKRAANMNQFYGVRGKKSIQNKRPYDLTFRGRFIGVRGKKDTSDFKDEGIKYLLGAKEMLPKRKSQVGFFGMRGKKWTDDSDSEAEDQQN